jgi:hypothetical protein
MTFDTTLAPVRAAAEQVVGPTPSFIKDCLRKHDQLRNGLTKQLAGSGLCFGVREGEIQETPRCRVTCQESVGDGIDKYLRFGCELEQEIPELPVIFWSSGGY